MKLDRIELADCTTPTSLVQAILKQIPDLSIPVPIEEVALALDIVQIEEVATDSFEGCLVTFKDKSEGTILFNSRNTRQRKRFTIGHELGHFLNPWHLPIDGDRFLCSSRDMTRSEAAKGNRAAQMEVEANRFSAELLMPDRHFRKDLRAFGGPELAHIIELARRYDMSKEATARRYVDLHDEACAVVISKNGSILYKHPGKEFPYITANRGQPLPNGSMSKTYREDEGVVSSWVEVKNYVWLSDTGSNVSSLMEQTLRQQNGFQMTLLYAELSDEDDADNDDLTERWTPRF